MQTVSVILPTYNEAENVKIIVPALSRLFLEKGIRGEIIVVDDNSPDGTAFAVAQMAGNHPVRLHVRKKERGLGSAVIRGIELARGDVCVVMDADLSHPVERLPEMLGPIWAGQFDATVGSRYIPGGGSTSWPFSRRVISRGAGLLARPLTGLSDPTSGFMAFRKEIFSQADLDVAGWKIVLELVVKTNPKVLEVPIVFNDRTYGKSKLGARAYIEYLRHLHRLYVYKYPILFQFFLFCMVGFSGLVVDTGVLVTLVDHLSFDPRVAALFAFPAAVTWNYVFDRLWVFKARNIIRISPSYFFFFSICVLGLGLRIGVMHLLIEYAGMGRRPWYVLASIIGIAAATLFNFLGSKYIAFSGKFRR